MYFLFLVIVSGIVNFAIGGLWYTKLFGNLWIQAVNFDENSTNSNEVAKTMILTIVIEMVVAWTVALLLLWTTSNIVLAGVVIGAAVVFSNIKNYLYERRPIQLVLINEGYKFVTILVTVLIFSLFWF